MLPVNAECFSDFHEWKNRGSHARADGKGHPLALDFLVLSCRIISTRLLASWFVVLVVGNEAPYLSPLLRQIRKRHALPSLAGTGWQSRDHRASPLPCNFEDAYPCFFCAIPRGSGAVVTPFYENAPHAIHRVPIGKSPPSAPLAREGKASRESEGKLMAESAGRL